jgi:hypothetical protein
MASHSAYNLAPEIETPVRGAEPQEIVLPDFDDDHHQGFWMPTRCWSQEYGPILNLNERRYYDVLALYYNKLELRAYPKREQMEAYFSPDGAEECRSRQGLAMLGLIEWWSEPVGLRHSRRFFRLPHVGRKGRHFGVRKQPSADELLELRRRNDLPDEYDWLRQREVRLLTPRVTPVHVADEVGRRMERWTSRRRN